MDWNKVDDKGDLINKQSEVKHETADVRSSKKNLESAEGEEVPLIKDYISECEELSSHYHRLQKDLVRVVSHADTKELDAGDVEQAKKEVLALKNDYYAQLQLTCIFPQSLKLPTYHPNSTLQHAEPPSN